MCKNMATAKEEDRAQKFDNEMDFTATNQPVDARYILDPEILPFC